MTEVLGDAFQSIAQALAQMQGAMWAMNEEMTRTDCAIGDIVRSLQEQGASVEKLDRRMLQLEERAQASCAPAPAPAAPPPAAYAYPYASPPPQFGPPPAAAYAYPPPAAPVAPSAASHVPPGYPASTYPPSTVSAPCPPSAYGAESCAPACPSARPTKRQVELGTRLVAAVDCGRLKHVDKMIKAGADVNFMAEGCDRSPLHRATEKGFADVVSLLLKRGANIGMRDKYGRTALHLAADNDYSSNCVGLLLQAGSDASSRDAVGRTPLHYAAACGNEASAIALLGAGGSKHAEDDRGKRPCDVAKMMCLRKLLQPRRSRRHTFTHSANRNRLCPALGNGNGARSKRKPRSRKA